MSGGSHDYAYSKVQMIAGDYGHLDGMDIDDVEDLYEVLEIKLKQHPLRVALARFLHNDLAPVLRSIEWSDSADYAPDAWVAETQEFLEMHNVEHDLSDIASWQAEYDQIQEEYLDSWDR